SVESSISTETHLPTLHDALPIFDAKAEANYKQGNAEARVLAERLEAEAGGQSKLGLAKAEAAKAMGEAEADAVGRRMAAEAEGRSEEQRLNSSHVKHSYAVFCLK